MLPDQPAQAKRLPLWLKLLYTLFVAVLVPVYWHHYGPINFLYFCDVALLMTVAAVWLESSLLASAALVGIFVMQMVWIADFCGRLMGYPLNELSAYMFNPRRSWFLRSLSSFHIWLPFLLLGIVCRLGYDRRALWVWTLVAWVLMLVSYYCVSGPSPAAAETDQTLNVAYVHGFKTTEAQTWMHADLYFALVMIVLPVGILLPSHLVFLRVLPRAGAAAHDTTGGKRDSAE